MHYSDGDVVRCAMMTMHEGDKFCYHHQKYFNDVGQTPAPSLWKQPGGKDGVPSGKYLVKVTDKESDEVRTFDYVNELCPAVTQW